MENLRDIKHHIDQNFDPKELNNVVDKLVENAKIIYSNMNNPNVRAMKDDERLELFQKKYVEFNKRFPITLRFMAELNAFHAQAFKIHVKSIFNKPPRSIDDFLRSQANYVKLLYMKTMSHYNMKQLNQIEEDAYKNLKKETDEFEKNYKEKESSLKEKHEEFNRQKKIELKNHLLSKIKK